MPASLLPRFSLALVCFASLAFRSSGLADSLVEIANGQQTVLVDKVLVRRDHVDPKGEFVYYYQLRDGKFLEEAYKVMKKGIKTVPAPAPERLAMLKQWKDAGWKVEVKDQQLKKITLYNFCVHPLAPRGKIFSERADLMDKVVVGVAPNPTTAVLFENIDQIDVKGDDLSIKLKDGKKVQGPIAVTEYRGEQCIQQLEGYEEYGPAEPKHHYVHWNKIREIRFIRTKKDESLRLPR